MNGIFILCAGVISSCTSSQAAQPLPSASMVRGVPWHSHHIHHCGLRTDIEHKGYLDLQHFNGFVQERCNSSALAMELRLHCTNPLIYPCIFVNFTITELYIGNSECLICANLTIVLSSQWDFLYCWDDIFILNQPTECCSFSWSMPAISPCRAS